jgi:hypothetical protein
MSDVCDIVMRQAKPVPELELVENKPTWTFGSALIVDAGTAKASRAVCGLDAITAVPVDRIQKVEDTNVLTAPWQIRLGKPEMTTLDETPVWVIPELRYP